MFPYLFWNWFAAQDCRVKPDLCGKLNIMIYVKFLQTLIVISVYYLGPNASCKNTKLRVKGRWINKLHFNVCIWQLIILGKWFFHTCVCDDGYIGNGVTCVKKSNGMCVHKYYKCWEYPIRNSNCRTFDSRKHQRWNELIIDFGQVICTWNQSCHWIWGFSNIDWKNDGDWGQFDLVFILWCYFLGMRRLFCRVIKCFIIV